MHLHEPRRSGPVRTSAARHTACHSRATGLHGTSLRETTRDEIKHEGNDAIEKRGRLGRVRPLFHRTLKKKKMKQKEHTLQER